MINRFFVGLFAALSGCIWEGPQTSPSGPVAYTVGAPYEIGGEWQYPRELDSYDATGLGVIIHKQGGSFTADNDIYRSDGLVAASPILPLPSIVTVTNLVNGYSVQVLVNDRGPAVPGRIIAVSPHVANLLEFPPGGVVEVGVKLNAQASAALQTSLGAGPKLQAAPVSSITSQSLAPPGSSEGQGATQQLLSVAGGGSQSQVSQLNGQVSITTPDPGPLWVRVSGFGSMDGTADTIAKLSGMPTRIIPVFGGERTLWAVDAGPYHSVEAADAALQEELSLGISGSEIVVR